jgi:hypothetical protein
MPWAHGKRSAPSGAHSAGSAHAHCPLLQRSDRESQRDARGKYHRHKQDQNMEHHRPNLRHTVK